MLQNSNVATRLPAKDLQRARRFYAEKLGLEPLGSNRLLNQATTIDQGNTIVILLCGGDKSTQSRDIARAKKMAKELE